MLRRRKLPGGGGLCIGAEKPKLWRKRENKQVMSILGSLLKKSHSRRGTWLRSCCVLGVPRFHLEKEKPGNRSPYTFWEYS